MKPAVSPRERRPRRGRLHQPIDRFCVRCGWRTAAPADEPWKEVSDDQDCCIRHYGFLAKGDRGETLARVHDLLQVQPTREPNAARELKADEHARDPSTVCPDCGGLMRRIGDVAQSPAAAFRCDTS